MMKIYDFSKGKRGPVIKPKTPKTPNKNLHIESRSPMKSDALLNELLIIASVRGIVTERITIPLLIHEDEPYAVRSRRVVSLKSYVDALDPSNKLYVYQVYVSPGDEFITVRAVSLPVKQNTI